MASLPSELHRVNGHDAMVALIQAASKVKRMPHDSHVTGDLLSELAAMGFYLGVADTSKVAPDQIEPLSESVYFSGGLGNESPDESAP